MHKSILNAAVAAALLAGASGVVMAEDSPISANVGFTSDYVYRGVSQSNENIAVQGGFDYAHDSGFYIGTWGSSIDWLDKGGAEVDVYAGFSNSIGDTDFSYDVGVLQYFYPGGDIAGESPDTTELYVGFGWKFLSFKYSYALNSLFGLEDANNDSDGSQYFDLGAEYEVGGGYVLGAHLGRQYVKNGKDLGWDSYNDWKVGVSKEYVGLNFALDYIDTDIDDVEEADSRVVFTVSKSF